MSGMLFPRPHGVVERRLAGMALVDAAGTGLFLASAAVYLVTKLGLSPAIVGLGLSAGGMLALLTTVPLGILGDRVGAPRLLVGLSLARAAGFTGFVFVRSPEAYLVLAAALGIADSAVPPLNQALVGLVVDARRRVGVMAVQRAVRNVGFTAGAGLAAVALALDRPVAYQAIFLANAASFLVVARVVTTLTRHSGSAGHRSPLLPSAHIDLGAPRRLGPRVARYRPVVLASVAVNGMLSLHMTLLGVGIPLWLVLHTQAPRPLAAVLVAVNTILAVGLQVPFTRATDDVGGAVRALRRAGLATGVACLFLAWSASPGATAASVLLLAAAVSATFAELWQSAGGWGLSFALAPKERQAEVLAVFGTGTALQQVLAPPLLIAVVFGAGLLGWVAVAVLIAGTGCLAVRITKPATALLDRERVMKESA